MKKNILSILFALFLFSFLSAQTNVDLDKLDAYFEQVQKDWEVPGMTIGIVKEGELIFSKGYGVKEVGKTERPDENTLYAIASNSKAFTSAMIALLVQEGKIGWNDKVKDYLPYFEVYDSWVSKEATIRDLLCHRIGLGTFSGDVIWYKSELTAEEIIKRIQHLPQAYDFRAGYGYSNLMYITAGELIKTVTGKSWGENIRERFLEPLGMDRTIYQLKDLERTDNYATPHAMEDGKNIPIPWANWDNVAATGGLISSVKDVGQWMIFNLNHGIWGQDTILTPASRNLIWTPHNNFTVNQVKPDNFNRHFSGYGLGWGLNEHHGRLRVSHGGGYDGMITAVNMIPDENLGVVVLTNGHKSPTMAVTYYTLDAFLGVPEKDWSAEMLASRNAREKRDTRVSSRKGKRVLGTEPSLRLEAYTGTYHSDIYGKINVSLEEERLKLDFEHSPALSASLRHWHFDVWSIVWDNKHAWFNFGTLKFNMDNNQEITGIDFDVPNNDIFFEELKAKRVK